MLFNKTTKNKTLFKSTYNVILSNFWNRIHFQIQKILCLISCILLQGNPYAMKDGSSGAAGANMSAAAAWSTLQPTAGYYGYDHPTLPAYG